MKGFHTNNGPFHNSQCMVYLTKVVFCKNHETPLTSFLNIIRYKHSSFDSTDCRTDRNKIYGFRLQGILQSPVSILH